MDSYESAGMVADNFPVVGAVKGVLEAETPLDVVIAVVSGLPGSGALVRYGGKAFKALPSIRKNAHLGALRQKSNAARHKSQYPGASVQNEQYLRTADGKIAKDPLTKTGRRLDHVVVENGCAATCRETTSMTANKTAQSAKEAAIRASGGTMFAIGLPANSLMYVMYQLFWTVCHD